MNIDFPYHRLLVKAIRRLQCDQIGLFLNVLSRKFSYKSSPNIVQLRGFFGQTPRPIGLLFIPSFGHTGWLQRHGNDCQGYEALQNENSFFEATTKFGGEIESEASLAKNVPFVLRGRKHFS